MKSLGISWNLLAPPRLGGSMRDGVCSRGPQHGRFRLKKGARRAQRGRRPSAAPPAAAGRKRFAIHAGRWAAQIKANSRPQRGQHGRYRGLPRDDASWSVLDRCQQRDQLEEAFSPDRRLKQSDPRVAQHAAIGIATREAIRQDQDTHRRLALRAATDGVPPEAVPATRTSGR